MSAEVSDTKRLKLLIKSAMQTLSGCDSGTLTSRYHTTSTPFQNAIYPLIFVAASDGSG